MSEADFADTFAQTVAYGMFLGRLSHSNGTFTRQVATTAIPESIPFLRSAVRLLSDEDLLPPAILRLLDDLAALLDNTQIEPIREEVAAGGLERDLVVYFYEQFLEQYDKGERKRRGVYYTPPELVGYLTRATQHLLERDFGLQRGLADPSVVLLDPAVGTGTFVLGMAERALAGEESAGTASQRRLIRDHLLPSFVGFELLPAPYAIAHLKLASFYEQFGYALGFDERLSIYLTNSLELSEIGPGAQLGLPMVRGIVEEGREAGRVKTHAPVLVIVGNPPYERTSHNANDHSDQLIEAYYRVDGHRISDRNTAPLKDDYLRFLRWAVWKLLEQDGAPGHGILAFVTNRRFLEGPLFRGVRQFLLNRFDEIDVFDLHGDQREWYGDREDEKVFRDVQAGIALTIFVKRPGETGDLATVRYREEFGSRAEKLLACQQASLEDDGWKELAPHAPLWLMVRYDVPAGYDQWPTVAQLFPRHVIGVQTHRDQLVVAHSRAELVERLRRFADTDVADAAWQEQGIAETDEWNLREARRALAREGPKQIMRWTYRAFDSRWVAFDDRLIDRTRDDISRHLIGRDNLVLAFAYGSLTDGPYTFVSRGPMPAAALSWRTFGQAYMAPLWTYDTTLGVEERQPNVAPGALERLRDAGITASAEELMHYVYAVLNGPDYRQRFGHGLRYLFPRIPITRDPELFDQIRGKGAELVTLHLLEHEDLETETPRMDGDDQARIEPAVFDEIAQEVRLGDDLRAHPVSAATWAYRQGAYPVLANWLSDRQGRHLTSEEFDDFRRISAAITLTLRCLPDLDDLIGQATQDAFNHAELGFQDPL